MTATPDTTAAPRLELWQPESRKTGETAPAGAGQAGDGYVVEMSAQVAERDLVALAHAASRNGMAARLFRSNAALDGETWYDHLPRITGMYIDVTTRGATERLRCPGKEGKRDEAGRSANTRPDRIVVGALVRDHQGNRRTLRLETDFAVASEARNDPLAAGIRLTRETALDASGLKTLIRHALGPARPRPGGGNRMFGRTAFDKAARSAAAELMQRTSGPRDWNGATTDTPGARHGHGA